MKSQEVTPEKQSVPISVQSEEKEKPPSEKPVSAEAAEVRRNEIMANFTV